MIPIGYQPRHWVDIPDIDEYQEFLQHRFGMIRFMNDRLFELDKVKVELIKSK